MAKKIYESVLGKLAVEVPLFAESILNKALDKVGATPSDVTAFQMKKAIDEHVEKILKEKVGLSKGAQELGAGIIVLNKEGNIRKIAPVVNRLLPDIEKREFIIHKDISSEIITLEDKTVKIITLPINTKSGEMEGAVCLVSDITLDVELDEEISSAYIQILDQNNELIKASEELQKSEKMLDKKIEQLKTNKFAMLNMLEDLQETIEAVGRAEKEIKELNRDLEKKVKHRTVEVEMLLKQKDEFINQLGHDLKTPLTPLVTLTPLIKKRIKDPESEEILDVIINNVEYMKNLIYKTLELARLNSPRVKFDIIETNLLTEASKIIENKLITLKEKDVVIENNIKGDIIVKADTLRLGEVFNNLIGNSIKYMPKGGTITFDAKTEEDVVTVSITDTGVGMTKEQLNQIFDEFYIADESRHDRVSSGLGLPICKRIVEKHNGKIWAESKGEGKGSTFYFTLKTKKRNLKSGKK